MGLPLRMRFNEDLRGILSEVLDHAIDRLSCDRIIDRFPVKGVLVRTIHEDIQSIDRCLPGLFVSEDQVDPLMQMSRDEIRFQGNAMDLNEFFRRVIRPGWQFHVVQQLIVRLQFAQIESIRIDEKFRQIEKLRNQFFAVVGRLENVRPRRMKRMKLSISNVESTFKREIIQNRDVRHSLSTLQVNV